MDQFIFFDDIHEFVNTICRIWGAPSVDFDEVIGWRIPLMSMGSTEINLSFEDFVLIVRYCLNLKVLKKLVVKRY